MSDLWRMSAEDAEEYTRALGQIMSGGWRQLALGLKLDVPATLGMTPEVWVSERIGGHIRMGLEERRQAAREMADPEGEFGFKQREIAAVLGVGLGTVNSDLRGVQDRTAVTSGLEEDGVGDVQDRTTDACAEPEPQPELKLEPDDEPTAGDVIDEVADGLEESGAYEQIEADRRIKAIWTFRMSWIRFVGDHPPGVLANGVAVEDLREVVQDCDRLIGWLQQAREVAARIRRPRRVGT